MLYSEDSRQEQEYYTAAPIFASRLSDEPLPKYKMKKESTDPQIVYQILKDELLDEGNARQNLATFCQTYMEPLAVRLLSECMEKNAIDKSEYPQTAEIENRCVNMIADLWNGPQGYIGTSTVGSSEACMLGGMAMKFRWRKEAEKAGIDIRKRKPNLVISSGYQICWEKFCVYWDIELRKVPMSPDHLSMDLDRMMEYVDEYTIGVVGILGITYTGKYDDIQGMDRLLEEYNRHAPCKVYIHVDAASGGMFAPFIQPELPWDFRLKNVISINTSGHKYGLVYPGIGWILWRGQEYLPQELVFKVSYLGGEMPTMAINFSRSASQIIGQYYNFMRYGFDGYKGIHEKTRDVALYISRGLEERGRFRIYNDGHNLPVVCWALKHESGQEWDLYDLADRLRMNGWQVPAYPLPENMQEQVIQRIVVRADLSMQLASMFLKDLDAAVADLNNSHILPGKKERQKGTYGFTH